MMRIIQSLGFGRSLRGSSQDRAAATPVRDFAPIERKVRGVIPEKRSQTGEYGDFKTNYGTLLPNPSSSGVAVNEHTALNVAAVAACVGLLSDMVAKLPLYLYRDEPSGPKEITDHPAIRLMGRSPSGLQTSFELRQLMETGVGLGGNGYAKVYRNPFGEPTSIQWLAPCDVQPRLMKWESGEKIATYHIVGDRAPLTRYNIIHVRGFSIDGFTGISPIRYQRECIGTAISQTAAAGKLMRNGARFPGIITTTAIQPDKVMIAAREEWDRNTTEGNLGRTPLLNGTFQFQQTNGMSMVDAQFLESRRFELQEIARFYRVPSTLIGDPSTTSWGSGIDQLTAGFLKYTLDSKLVGWEESLAATLLTEDEREQGLYFKFDREQLEAVAIEAQGNFYQTMRNIGVFSANDIRRKLNEPIISKEDGGDDYGRPFNSSGGTPKDGPAAKPEKKPTSEPVAA